MSLQSTQMVSKRQAIGHAAAGGRNFFDAAIIRAKREIDRTDFAADEAVWLEVQVASPPTVVELRPVRQVAQDRKDDKFCCRYDALSTRSCA